MNLFERLILVILQMTPVLAYAQQIDLDTPQQVSNAVSRVAEFLSTLLFAVSVIVVIIAGFMYLTAGGNEQQVTKANKTLTYAVVGLVVGASAYSLPYLIQNIL